MRLGGLSLVLLAVLAGCTSRGGEAPASGSLRAFSSDGFTSCVPFARAVTGIDIRGDAWSWWDLAAGRYLRGNMPEAGAVLVLAQTDRLRLGHVAVVRQVIDSRDILVDHSNWVPGRIITGMQVQDVSPDNDWTQLRFFNPQYGVFGSIYPADGFIYQMPPLVPASG
jgi:surface antigen